LAKQFLSLRSPTKYLSSRAFFASESGVSTEYEILSKIDARKSFSNPSFKQYYNRGQYVLIPFEQDFSVICQISEAKKAREDKCFVGLRNDRNCLANQNSNRHPLLALSASTSYIITIATKSKTPINIRVKPELNGRMDKQLLLL